MQKGAMNKEFACICLSLGTAFVVQTMLLVAVPLAAIELGATPLILGLIVSAPYILPLLLALPFGSLVARLGSPRTLQLGAVAMVIGAGLLVVIPGFQGLIAGQLVIGLAQLLMIISAQTAITYLGQGTALERYFGWYTTYLSIGQMVGPLLAGWIIDHRGGPGAAFYGAFIASFLTLASLLMSNQRTSVNKQPSISFLTSVDQQWHLLKTSLGVKLSLIISLAAMLALGAHGSYFPVYLESLALSGTAIGLLVSLRAFASMAVRPFTSAIVSLLHGRYATMSLTLIFMALGLMLVGMTGNVYWLCLFSVFVGLGVGLSQPLSMVVIAESVPERQRSHALAVRLMANRAMQFAAPLLLGLVTQLSGFTVAYLVCGALLLLHWIVFKWLKRQHQAL
ncbi:MFS transporter [Vreelandella venusta]|uniref:MFS transporter n=1 Tax=Vreelandella venusta TaxID=44935 RepID=A0ABX2BB98_9GAMM|nr:MFS transporter [Halomonas venusta]AZM97478.1 MFS transporter [Halomonas venusta]NPT31282.1 MFS transporter [Halomonas venusta]